MTVTVSDGSLTDSETFTITCNEVTVNQPPTIVLTNVITGLAENADTSSAVRIADIEINDDALGSNLLTLAGPDAESFEIVGSQIFLRAGTPLDFETKTSFHFTVAVDDATIPGSPDDAHSFTLDITDINETPTQVTGVPPETVEVINDIPSSPPPIAGPVPEESIHNEIIIQTPSENVIEPSPIDTTETTIEENYLADGFEEPLLQEENFREDYFDETVSLEGDLRNITLENDYQTNAHNRNADSKLYNEFRWSSLYSNMMHESLGYKTYQPQDAKIFTYFQQSELPGFNQNMTEYNSLESQLDHLYNDMDDSYALAYEQKNFHVKIVTGVFTTFAVGVVSYLMRAGSLMSCFLSTAQIWKKLDPIAVLPSKKKKKGEKEISAKTDSDSDVLPDTRENK